MTEAEQHAARIERVAAQLAAERVQGWSNPLVGDLVDAARFLRNEPTPVDTGEAVLSNERRTDHARR